MIYHIYIISFPERAKKNIYKIGKHSGTKEKLYKRYRHSLINPKIYFFVEVNNYTLIETLIKQKLDVHRIKFPDGSKSEWVKLELEKIIKCIKDSLKYDVAKPNNQIEKIREDNENLEKDYLLKNTNIPYPYVDYCYDIISFVYNKNDICIDLETIANMIGCRKRNLKRTLIKHFKDNIDYIIESGHVKKKGSGGHNIINIRITLTCLKELFVVLHIPRVKIIRNYLLQTEKILEKYDKIITSAFFQ